jgi:KaiC/GvpD/RAD55 family RecA-like ATPase
MGQSEGSKEYYLSTGIKELNEILEMDKPLSKISAEKGGFRIGQKDEIKGLETPIILINGETGAGKTTLMLQIAFCAARGNIWIPCFCSLEQSVRSLEDVSNSFDEFTEVENQIVPSDKQSAVFGEENGVNPKKQVNFFDLADSHWDEVEYNNEIPNIYVCHLSPKPISESENSDVFQARLDQLEHIIEKSQKMDKLGRAIPVFFLDSMNAFSTYTLKRNEIYRLFALFRNHHIPAVISMEHHVNTSLDQDLDCVQNAKFLADIVISLTKNGSDNYLKYFLEIEKSRVSRQALGKHIYKIRTATVARKVQYDRRTGIVLYPSVHPVLSKAREQESIQSTAYLVSENDKDLRRITIENHVKSGACFSIIGPPGSHKLALGMNIAMGYHESHSPSMLIVNFGGSGEYNFRGVAWTKSRSYCRNLKSVTYEKPGDGKLDIHPWKQDFLCTTEKTSKTALEQIKGDPQTKVTLLTINIGQITPEECFFMIEKAISEAQTCKQPFSSVLLSDTAELCNGYPLLASDPLFLPALIDLFAARRLVTVCIGVDAGESARNKDVNFSLSSRADYRIVLSHYPDVRSLSERIVENRNLSSNPKKEQFVCLVVDNVTGKHYGRQPRWLSVLEKGNNKALLCKMDPKVKMKSKRIIKTEIKRKQ